MKILVLAPQPFYQDRRVPISLKTLLETLASEDHELTAMMYPEGEHIVIPGCRILRARKLPLVSNIGSGFSWKNIAYDIVMMQMTGRLLKREEFDLIHAGPGAIFMARYFSKRFNIPYVYDMDSSLSQELCEKLPSLSALQPLLRRYEQRAVQGSAGVLTSCRHLERLARSHSDSVPIQRLEAISLLPADMPKEKQKETDLGLKKGTLTLMYVGNLERYQGIDLLLEAFSLANLEQENIRLVIIGGSKADISHYRRKAKDIGVADDVVFTGSKPVKDLAGYLAQADILVSPRTGGYTIPMKIFSYLDSGRAVLATRLETHTQVLDDSIAMLVDAVDSDMAAGIMRLVRDEQLRNDLAANARQRVAKEYTRQAYTLKLHEFYDHLQQELQPA